jgi:hypothetical protein
LEAEILFLGGLLAFSISMNFLDHKFRPETHYLATPMHRASQNSSYTKVRHVFEVFGNLRHNPGVSGFALVLFMHNFSSPIIWYHNNFFFIIFLALGLSIFLWAVSLSFLF